MKKVIEIKQMGGLKCDNPNCDYVNEFVPPDDYKNWINCLCPKCGENLLTEKDYKSFKRLLFVIKIINKIGKYLPKSDKKVKMQVSYDGTGTPSFNVKEDN